MQLTRQPRVSSTRSVVPSGVMAMPLGKSMSSAATDALPSGSIRTRLVGTGSPPAMRSKPNWPT